MFVLIWFLFQREKNLNSLVNSGISTSGVIDTLKTATSKSGKNLIVRYHFQQQDGGASQGKITLRSRDILEINDYTVNNKIDVLYLSNNPSVNIASINNVRDQLQADLSKIKNTKRIAFFMAPVQIIIVSIVLFLYFNNS